MFRLRLVLFALLLILPLSPAYAHGEHDRNHDHNALCERFLPKTEAGIPDLTESNWKEIKTIVRSFTYTFYRDSTRPHLAVAAMIVIGKPDPSTPLTRLTWQVDDEMRSVQLELDEMVCVKSVIGKDGKIYSLEGLLERLAPK